ncbi:hypothetical protein GCM10011584_11230 [Nocardioides phosphati]|uniref:UDP-N-acetyl-alpha-D-muramoyl-L-alanyl-L-glutamate epimerase n=1 Tax=Nocardioides phosphati TaxID=1867775 RepID=A0ABQ2N7C2_9ACTN|nr:hypothetical protein [Nocardioides phosphati]GGO87197.1 hypothetical protein GCM10011584_11230 [Nocardioides phosphati]
MSDLLHVAPAELVFHVDEPRISPDGAVIELDYRIAHVSTVGPVERFTETVTLPAVASPVEVGEGFRALARLLALAAGTSYYKALVPGTISVAGGLTDAERHFLTEVVKGGLAEFAYRNDLPQALFPVIQAPALPAADGSPVAPTHATALVAVGGGKDSIVTLESVRRVADVTLFSVNSYEPITRTAEASGLELVQAKRVLDKRLFALNEAGAHNGHVPVTAVNSIIACLIALRGGFDTVVFANEASSSYGNLEWHGVEVNHQWSKGLGFEGMLRSHVSPWGVDYVSFLRPLTELAIVRRFAQLPYLDVFTSCNRAFHLDASRRRNWCGECPKCTFVFLMLSPFVPRAQMDAIFGKDLFADESLRPLFLDLLAIGDGHKPFECVGEPSECRAAYTLLQTHPDWSSHPFVTDPSLREAVVSPAEVEALFSFSDQHFLTGALEKAAREVL